MQFDEYQEEKTCSIIINDDTLFEGTETFDVELVSPTFAVLGKLNKVTIFIQDVEDSTVLFILKRIA